MANWTYDPSQYSEKNFELIPAGDHRARIADVVEKTFKSGNQGYEIALDINGHAAKAWFYLVLDPSNPQQTNQRIGDFFNSFGITSPAMGSGKQWIGAVGAVRVKHEDYNGQTSAKVAFCIAKKNQDKLAPWKAGNSAPQMTAAPEISDSDLPFDM